MIEKRSNIFLKIGLIALWLMISLYASVYITTLIFGTVMVDGIETITDTGLIISLVVPILGAIVLGTIINKLDQFNRENNFLEATGHLSSRTDAYYNAKADRREREMLYKLNKEDQAYAGKASLFSQKNRRHEVNQGQEEVNVQVSKPTFMNTSFLNANKTKSQSSQDETMGQGNTVGSRKQKPETLKSIFERFVEIIEEL